MEKIVTLRTKTAVTYRDPAQLITPASKNSVVTLEVLDYRLKAFGGIAVFFKYTDADGLEIETKHKDGRLEMTKEALLTASQNVNASLPADSNLLDRVKNEIKIFAIAEMAQSFNILATDIEEVTL